MTLPWASVFAVRPLFNFFGEVPGVYFDANLIFIFEVWFMEVISDDSLVRRAPLRLLMPLLFYFLLYVPVAVFEA